MATYLHRRRRDSFCRSKMTRQRLTLSWAGLIQAAVRPFNRSAELLDNFALRFAAPFCCSAKFLGIDFVVFGTGLRRRSKRNSSDSRRDGPDEPARWTLQSCAR